MKLFASAASPFVRKVRVAALELGLHDRIEIVPTQVAINAKNEAYAASVNPLRKIPALATDDGLTLMDSSVICEYLDDLAGGGRLLPRGGRDRWVVLTEHAVAHGMIDAAVLGRYETAIRPKEHQWGPWLEDQLDRVWDGLKWFENRGVADAGAVMTINQITLACALAYLDFRYADRPWRDDFPKLAGWFKSIAQRPSIVATAAA